MGPRSTGAVCLALAAGSFVLAGLAAVLPSDPTGRAILAVLCGLVGVAWVGRYFAWRKRAVPSEFCGRLRVPKDAGPRLPRELACTRHRRDEVAMSERSEFGMERVLSEAEGGVMRVRHLRVEGANREIGRTLAGVAVSRFGLRPEMLKEARSGGGRMQAEYLRCHAPILWSRALGVADELGVDPETHDVSTLPYNQAIDPFACSLVFYPPESASTGHAMASRNYDFPLVTMAQFAGSGEGADGVRALMGDPYLLELRPTDGGYASLSMCSYDLLGGTLDGVNSEGLVVCVNGDEVAWGEGGHTAAGGVGFHELSCMRELLDSCATTREAHAILEGAEFYVGMIPCHYLVADRTGAAFIFERDRDGGGRFIDASREPTILTNHPLHRFPDRTTFPEPLGVAHTGTTSFERQIRLEDAVREVEGRHTIDDMRSACESVLVGEVIGRLPDGPRKALASSPGTARTLWHVLYDATESTMDVRFYIGEVTVANGGFREQLGETLRLVV